MSHPRRARSCAATTNPATADLAATDVVPNRLIEELVVRRRQAPAGLLQDQAEHETIAGRGHWDSHTVGLYYTP